MAVKSKRSTIYIQEDLHKALRLKAAETDSSMSDIINDALRASLEDDAADLGAIRARRREPSVSFEEFVTSLKASGKL